MRFCLSICLMFQCCFAMNFWEWQQVCEPLPQYKKDVEAPSQTPLSWCDFQTEAYNFRTRSAMELRSSGWLDWRTIKVEDLEREKAPVQMFVAKNELDAGAVIGVHGDFHGDIHSINRFIEYWTNEGYLDPVNPFRIIKPNFYILFLGDYVDRGWWGCEVLYTVLRLKNENWDQVMLVRGNHEAIWINARDGFEQEFKRKYSTRPQEEIQKVYNYLPCALFLGCEANYVQCCHGGMELGHNPGRFLESRYEHAMVPSLNRAAGLQLLFDRFTKKVVMENKLQSIFFLDGLRASDTIGYMWSDFSTERGTILKHSSRGNSIFEYGEKATEALLSDASTDECQLRCVLRAHQHSPNLSRPMMQRICNLDDRGFEEDTGLGKLWNQGSGPGSLDGVLAVTFCVSPGGERYPVPWDAFGKLTLASDYSDWRLEAIRAPLD